MFSILTGGHWASDLFLRGWLAKRYATLSQVASRLAVNTLRG